VKAPHGSAEATQFSLSDADKKELLALARTSVEHSVEQGHPYQPEPAKSEALNRELGAFVTLKMDGDLRGCIGYTSAVKPLYLTVRDTATLAASRDPRFQPVSVFELPRITYEVSVLSPLRRATSIEQIKVGEHGLLMKNGDSEGLLLPQVPVEEKWDRQTFLEQTCRKAGMAKDCWKEENTDIFMFTAVVFDEPKR
jgi:AmmeMemoRadiSam system protein A